MKVITVVGTRPELIRLARVIPLFDSLFDHILVHTGQNYDSNLSKIFFDDLQIREPNYQLKGFAQSFAQATSRIITEVDDIFQKEDPDALLILGDTNSALCSISAKRRKIPIFHIEAGNRCFDLRVPEEINRKIVDHISDINICYSDFARSNLLREGLLPDKTIRLGSPVKEVIDFYLPRIMSSPVLEQLSLTKGNYFVASLHRQENIDSDSNLSDLVSTLNCLMEKYKSKRMILSLHPRTRSRINHLNLSFNRSILLSEPLKFSDYLALQINSACTISDSGSITEESSILGFPSLTVRESFEGRRV